MEYNHYEITELKQLAAKRNVLEINCMDGQLTRLLTNAYSRVAVDDWKCQPWMAEHGVTKDYSNPLADLKLVEIKEDSTIGSFGLTILNRIRGPQNRTFYNALKRSMGAVYLKEWNNLPIALYYQKAIMYGLRRFFTFSHSIIGAGAVFKRTTCADPFPSFEELVWGTVDPVQIEDYYANQDINILDRCRRLRVCFCTPGFNMGGAERWILALCRNFPAKIRVSGVVIESEEHTNVEMLRKLPRETRLYFGNECIPDAARNADVVVVWGAPNMCRILGTLDTPTVVVAHGAVTANDYSKTIMSAAYDAGLRTFAAVNEACIPVMPDGIEPKIIRNGVEYERVVPSGYNARRYLNVREDEKCLLYFGRIMTDKLVNRLPTIIAKMPEPWVLRMVGNMAYFPDGTAERWLELSEGRLEIRKPLHHVGDLLSVADKVILLSESEAHPMSLTEAWAAGVPTVTSSLPWLDGLEEQYGKLTVRVDNDWSDATIAELVAVADDPIAVINAHNVCKEELNAVTMATKWATYLESIANAGCTRISR